jgi:hypothetical protein
LICGKIIGCGNLMTVKEILDDAMRLTGRDELDGQGSEGNESKVKYAMLFCLNAVIDELARGYFPIRKREELTSDTGRYDFSNFAERPVKIVKVTSGAKKIGWHIYPEYFICDKQNVTVEYEYVPNKLTEDDEFDYPDVQVSFRLVEYGIAAEYMLICGEVESAAMWEQKYRQEIDRLLSLRTVRERIPPRRWL